jgi:isopenicillin N synthase-like dioxygenase
MNKIPSVNLLDFLSDDPKVKQKFVDEIGQAYETIGFVALKGHFLEDPLVDKLYSEIKSFLIYRQHKNNVMKFQKLVVNVGMYLLVKKVPKEEKKAI